MPIIETKGAASAQGYGEFAKKAGVATYIEDVFSTYLYTGNGSTQTITNGIDLSGKGGLVWTKTRGNIENHNLQDTVRGAGVKLSSNLTQAQVLHTNSITSFTSTGYALGSDPNFQVNGSGYTYASWTFRKQPKFFDIVTWTGDGTSGQTISHSLGSTPGCIIVKRTDAAENWVVYHKYMFDSAGTYGSQGYMNLNLTSNSNYVGTDLWSPTATTFKAFGTSVNINTSGATYVAYLFAHDAGGFGLTGTDNVISCGSFTTDGSSNATVNLGYEPQWLLYKRVNTAGNWYIEDTMRGLYAPSIAGNTLIPNNTTIEGTGNGSILLNSTGFTTSTTGNIGPSETFIYIAIRRGPMKVPTDATKVFAPVIGTTDANFGFPADFVIFKNRAATSGQPFFTRLLDYKYLNSSNTFAEGGSSGDAVWNASQTTFSQALTGASSIFEGFRRAPGFFDVVCYTGTGSNTTVNHNLGVVPEMIIVKARSAGTANWQVYHSAYGPTLTTQLNLTNAQNTGTLVWNSTTPTASVFSIGTSSGVNSSGTTYVAYLFASCPGVSKVGTYTGNGSSQTINCGFTAGARFVLIKRTDSTGDWYVWDTARGMVAGNDPHLSLNTTAAEVTTDDSVDTDNSGFIVNQLSATNINVSSATYIYLAIA